MMRLTSTALFLMNSINPMGFEPFTTSATSPQPSSAVPETTFLTMWSQSETLVGAKDTASLVVMSFSWHLQ